MIGERGKAHAGLLFAMVAFGLMSPLSKDIINQSLTGLQLATLRISGAALLLWCAAPFAPRQHVPRHDLMLMAIAGLLGVVIAQGGFIVGVELTSPINSAIEVTSQPIFAMLMAAIIMHEHITVKTSAGILLGFAGACMLIMSNAPQAGPAADYRGDLIILGSQLGFAVYLTVFPSVIRRYHVLVFNKWMFTFAAIAILPVTIHEMLSLDVQAITSQVFLEIAFIIVVCTFVNFIIVTNAQRVLAPTTVSTYNYLQPLIASIASIGMGLATLRWQHFASTLLIFTGVWLVINSNSHHMIRK